MLLSLLQLNLEAEVATPVTLYVRADGSESTFANATGPATNAANCMSAATYNSGRAALNDGDTVIFSGRGGSFTVPIFMDQGGSSDYITYLGEVGQTPTIDLSGGAESDSPIMCEGANLAYIDIDNFTLVGNSLASALSRNETGTGTTTIKLGTTYGITVTSNNAANTQCDGFNWHGNCLDVCGTLEANYCAEATPSTGAFQGFTTHDTSHVTITSASGANNNEHVTVTGASSITIGTMAFGLANNDPFVVGTTGATSATGITINGGTLTAANSSLGQINAANNPGFISISNATITLTGSGGSSIWGGTYTLSACTLDIDSSSFRIVLLDGGGIEMLDCPDITIDTVNAYFINIPVTSGTSGAYYNIQRCVFNTSNNWDGVSPSTTDRLIRHDSRVSGGPACNFVRNTVNGFAGDVDFINVLSGTEVPPTVTFNQFNDIACDVLDIDTSSTKDNNALINSNTFYNCANPTQITNASYITRGCNHYTGTTPDESGEDTEPCLITGIGFSRALARSLGSTLSKNLAS